MSLLTDIRDAIGDAGSDAIERVKQEIIDRYGAAAWEALPSSTKQAAIASAWADVKLRTSWVPWAVAGGALLWALTRRRR